MNKEGMILIGDVSKKLGIHDQTIRMYERKNLIKLQRTANGTRLFSKNDMTKITIIITLTQEVGLNLSGVKIVFVLAKKLKMSDDELLDFIYDHSHEFKT